VAAWFVAGLLVTLFQWPTGQMPHNILTIGTLVGLVVWPLATVIGAKFYTEGAGMGSGMGSGASAHMGSRM
jgi:hypothetical protein